MNFVKNIFLKIANLVGLELQQKQINSKAEEYPITKAISNKLATLTLMDSDISIVGNGKKALYLQEMLQAYIYERIEVACEIALLTGDCLLKPYTDGHNIGIDVIKSNDFYICESIGNFIKSVIVKCDEIKTKYTTYTRYEFQTIKQINGISYLIIKQFAFKNETLIKLSDVASWSNIKEEQIIPNVKQILMGKIKSPTVNTDNVNSVNGVMVTNGLDKAVKYVIDSYNRLNKEVEDKETIIFASRKILTKNKDGVAEIPKGKDRLFYLLKGTEDTRNLIDIYSPDIRVEELEKTLEINLKMLEMLCGLSSGVLTSPKTNFATATEMKACLQSTFAFMNRFRHNIEFGVQQLFYGIDILLNANNIVPVGEFNICFNWSSSYVEQLNEQFNRLLHGESVGVVKPEEIRAFIFDEDLQTAKKNIEEIAKKTLKK